MKVTIFGAGAMGTAFAMHSARLGLDTALKELQAKSGFFYDADVVDACLRLFRQGSFMFSDKKEN